jgi:hypothetical protein
MKEKFLTVTALEITNEIGDAEFKRVELKINYDLIGAIQGNTVLLKDEQTELLVGDKRFSDILLPEKKSVMIGYE